MTQFHTFTDAERAALKAHRLDTHRPSQLADAFVAGLRFAREGDIVVTRNPAGQIVAVTRQDADGRIVQVIAACAAGAGGNDA